MSVRCLFSAGPISIAPGRVALWLPLIAGLRQLPFHVVFHGLFRRGILQPRPPCIFDDLVDLLIELAAIAVDLLLRCGELFVGLRFRLVDLFGSSVE